MLEVLQPQKVFQYFEEITRIPHGSGNTKAISDYCVRFAKEHGLEYVQDELNNVIIMKQASSGREKDAAVILQGHLDMVAVKEPDSSHDFLKDALPLAIHGDWISSTKTSLGGDDGIAVAYALAVLDDDTISHPRLEVVLTVDEEVGMTGAMGIDLSMLQGKYLINLDSEEEGYILTSCAGGLHGEIGLPVQYADAEGVLLQVAVEGLLGGHSGAEIQKERANAIKLAGRLLHTLHEAADIGIAAFYGGEKDNAIPRGCTIELYTEKENVPLVKKLLESEEAIYKKEYAVSDGGVSLRVTEKGESLGRVLTPASQEKLIFLLVNLPNGVQNMSVDLPGLVETSLNIGIAGLSKERFSLTASIRSSVRSRKYAVGAQVRYLTEFLGGEFTVRGEYPEWEYKRDSHLRELAEEVYEEMFGKKPVVQAIHAGLECGLLLEKCPGLDIISIGPDMKDIHTPKEMLSISSTQRTWEYLKAILKKLS